jgi:hypothetical protein
MLARDFSPWKGVKKGSRPVGTPEEARRAKRTQPWGGIRDSGWIAAPCPGRPIAGGNLPGRRFKRPDGTQPLFKYTTRH